MTNWHDIGSASLSTTAVTAAAASTITKTLLYPMDTLKCRMQSLTDVTRIWKFKGIFNGLIPKIALYAPYQSLYMTTYTWTRDRIARPGELKLWTFATAGVTAELAGSIVRVPMETIKQRMQTGVIPSNRALVSLLLENPFRFYQARNFVAQTLVHDIPSGIVHWTVYEYVKRSNGEGMSSVTAGAAAGAAAAILTNPLDVVKTRMITRPEELSHKTPFSTARQVLLESGVPGFYRGLLPRILHIAPNSALYMFVFDSLFGAIHSYNNSSE